MARFPNERPNVLLAQSLLCKGVVNVSTVAAGGLTMTAVKKKPVAHPSDTSIQVSRAVADLSTEHERLDAPLLDAAVAGVVLSFNPQNAEMRALAAASWKRIRATLSHHLLSEKVTILPLTEGKRLVTRSVLERMRKRHAELRRLARTVDSVSFETGPREEVAVAGKALCDLAVKLDDVIEGEERGLLPKLRRYVFAGRQQTAS